VVSVPTEAVNTGADGIPFVYSKNKLKKIVVPGESNDKFIVIEKGLKAGERVYLAQPPDADSFRLEGEDLVKN